MRPRVFERIGDDAGVARSLRRIADVYWLRCRVAPGEPLLERALEHARARPTSESCPRFARR